MRPLLVTLFGAIVLVGCESRDGRTVVGNTLDSPSLPDVAVRVDTSFVFAGSFDIEILANSDEWPDSLVGSPIAAGERFVFVDVGGDGEVKRLFIVQFEGFLDNNDQTYNYSFANADTIGENVYRHNTWFYNSREQATRNPAGEGAKTRRFLADREYAVEDEFMMSRFVGLASEDRRNEIIIYYIEMLRSSTTFTLAEWESTETDGLRDDIVGRFVDRSRESFDIVRG